MEEYNKVVSVRDERKKYRRRYYTLAAAVRNFAAGVEYTVVGPSIWFYLQQFHGSNFFLGVLQSSFQFSGVIAITIVGRMYDKTRRTKLLVGLSNFAEIIGNAVYSLGYSKYLLLVGRLLCGLGEGFASAVYAEVGSVLTSSERLRAIALMEGGRAIGGVIGPLTNFAFMKVNTHVGSWHITYGSAAGLVMFVIWILVQCLTMTFMYDMYREEYQENTMNTNSTDESKAALLDEMQGSDTDDVVDDADVKPIQYLSVRECALELFSLEPLVVMTADVWFSLSVGMINALLPIVLTEDFHYGTSKVAIIYVVMTSILVATFVGIQFVGKIDEIRILMACCIVYALVYVDLIVYHYLRPHLVAMQVIFISGIVIISVFYAFTMIAGRTLLTKLVSVENQGFTQGVYSALISLAMTLGPLIGSSVLHHLHIWGAIGIVIYTCNLVMLLMLQTRIRTRAERIEEARS